MPELPDRIPGEIIFASFSNQLIHRSIQRYTDATQRNAENPLPETGDCSFLTGSGIVSSWNGTTWVDLIDDRGGQTIAGDLNLGSLNFLAPAGNIGVDGVNQLTITDGVVNVIALEFALGSDILPSELTLNLGDETTSSNTALRWRNGLAPGVRGQFVFDNQARFKLDVEEFWLSVTTSSLADTLRYDSTINGNFTGQINGGEFQRVMFGSTSTERNKNVSDKPMTTRHRNHPIHLLKVPFVRWTYKPGVLEEGDPREGEEWFGPTAEGMASVYEFGADPDGKGGWNNTNDKVVREGLLWHIQELTKRVEALEAK